MFLILWIFICNSDINNINKTESNTLVEATQEEEKDFSETFYRGDSYIC